MFGPPWEKRDIVWSQLSGSVLKFILVSRLHCLSQACWWPPGFLEFRRIKEITCKITRWHSFLLKRHLGSSLFWGHINFTYILLMYLWSCWDNPTPSVGKAHSCCGQLRFGSEAQWIIDVELKLSAKQFCFPTLFTTVKFLLSSFPSYLWEGRLLYSAWAGRCCPCCLQRRRFPAGVSQVQPLSTRILKPFVPKCVSSVSIPTHKPFLWCCQHPDAREVFQQLFLWLDNAPCAKTFYSISLTCQNVHQNLLFLHLRSGQMLCKVSLFKMYLRLHCTSFVFS